MGLAAGALGSRRRQPAVTRSYTTVWMIESLGEIIIPVSASLPLGAMFHHVGTAAIQQIAHP
jgi:hypothetical protein